MVILADIILDFLYRERPPIYLFITKKLYLKDIHDLSRKASVYGFDLKLSGKAPLYRFTVKYRVRSASGILLKLKNDTLIFIVPSSSTESSVAHDVVFRSIRRLYPLIVCPLISVRSFFSIIDELSAKYLVFVEEYLLRRKRGRRSFKAWMREPYSKIRSEILDDMRKKRSVIDAIKLALSHDSKHMVIKIDRRGMITIYEMTPDALIFFQEDILYRYFEEYYKEYNRLRKVKRELRKTDSHEELTITTMQLLFGETRLSPKDFPKLINALRESFYVSIYYYGNPWMHLGLIDKGDGSSFEIIVSPSKAKIIPSLKAETSSLNLIIDAFRTVVPEPEIKLV